MDMERMNSLNLLKSQKVKFMQPIEYATFRNFPNPFNSETKIEFAMPETGQTTLKVYDIIGEEVMTLFDGLAESEKYYQVSFNPASAGLSTGIYYARLQFGEQEALMKMLCLNYNHREVIFNDLGED